MGFFSWKTQDTNKNIWNQFSNRKTFSVTMTDNKGNKWTEENYEGYGVFGGKDFYELLAEMNGKEGREAGINLAFGDKPYLSPNLHSSPSKEWENRSPAMCEYQGYFI